MLDWEDATQTHANTRSWQHARVRERRQRLLQRRQRGGRAGQNVALNNSRENADASRTGAQRLHTELFS